MVLSNHIITGTFIAQHSEWWLAFPLAIVAHFLLDAIPHWDYSIKNLISSLKENPRKSFTRKILFSLKDKDALKNIAKILTDLLLGLSLGAMVFLSTEKIDLYSSLAFLLAIFASLLPDLLIIPSKILKNKTLKIITYFHTKKIHATKKLKKYPYGLPLQVLIFLAILLLTNLG